MVNRVILGDLNESPVRYGLKISQAGTAVETAGLDELLFDSINTIASLPVYKIYDVTVAAGSLSGGIVTPGSFGPTTHTSGGLGYIPFTLGYWKSGSTTLFSDHWLLADSVTGNPSMPSQDGFTWEITESQLTVYNYFTSQQTFKIVIFYLDVSGGSVGTALDTPVISESTGFTSHDGWIIDWTAISGATGYRMDVATDVDFTTFPTLDQTYNNYLISGGGTESRVISSANASTTYYTRIRAVSATDTSEDSNTEGTGTDATTAPTVVIGGASTVYQDSSSFTPSFTVTNGGVSCTTTFTNNKGATNPSTITNTQEGVALTSRTWTNIPRSATSGSYTITPDFTDVGPGSPPDDSVTIYRPAINLPTSVTVNTPRVTPTNAFGGIRIVEGATNRGYLQDSDTGPQGSGYGNHTNAIQPNNDSAVNIYWVRYTSLSGSLSTSPTMSVDTWYQLTQTREWYVARTSDTPGGGTATTFTLQIAASNGGSVIDSSSVSLTAEVTSVPAAIDLSTITNSPPYHCEALTVGFGSQTATATVTFLTDGTITHSTTNGDGGADNFPTGTEWWDAAPDTGIGTGKYIRFEAASSPASGWNGASLNTWHELTSNRLASLTITSSSTNHYIEDINIWVNDSASKTGAESCTITLKAEVNIL